eukprot:205837-Rhodomonas_salina.1
MHMLQLMRNKGLGRGAGGAAGQRGACVVAVRGSVAVRRQCGGLPGAERSRSVVAHCHTHVTSAPCSALPRTLGLA